MRHAKIEQLFLLCAIAWAGCSGSSVGADGGRDSGASALEQLCTEYCECMSANCGDVGGTSYVPGGSTTACVDDCVANPERPNGGCRASRCLGVADGTEDPATACPEAASETCGS